MATVKEKLVAQIDKAEEEFKKHHADCSDAWEGFTFLAEWLDDLYEEDLTADDELANYKALIAFITDDGKAKTFSQQMAEREEFFTDGNGE